MARKVVKKGFQQSSGDTKASIKPVGPSKIPTPFKPVSGTGLEAFASTLPKDHFYLVHVDRTSIAAKKQAFLVPVVLNTIILLGMITRIYYAAPIYLSLAITVYDFDTSYAVDQSIAASTHLLKTILDRTMLFATDYAIFWLIGSWPREFVGGSAINRGIGPLSWRWRVGLQEEEVIVRRGRNWDADLVGKREEARKDWNLDDEMLIKFKVDPAMNKEYISKTGLSLLDRYWDLDYKAMVDAHRFMKDGRVTLEELENCALVFYQNQWIFWRVREKPNEAEMAGDPKVQNFKQKLTELGCEDVFYRYMEVLQYESNQPGGFTKRAQMRVEKELDRMVTEKGVDYNGQFWKDIGGYQGIPGL